MFITQLSLNLNFCTFGQKQRVMIAIELKQKLTAKIGSTYDEELLHQLLRVMELESKTDEYYRLNSEEEKAVNEGISQLDRGVFLSNDEANRQADQCLKK